MGQENCADGQDNDNDGLIDCRDPQCTTDANCKEGLHCADSVDNDVDGLTARDQRILSAWCEWRFP